MTEQILIYLCPKLPPAIETDDASYDTEISYNDTQVIVPMVPKYPNEDFDCLYNKTITLNMMQDGSNLLECLFEGADISWKRGVDHAGDPLPYLIVEYQNPEGECVNCIWYSTTIAGRTPGESSFNYPPLKIEGKAFTPIPVGTVPESGDKEDYFVVNADIDGIHNEPQPNLYPGENLCLIWGLKILDKLEETLVFQVLFVTPLLVGGVIQSIENDDTVDKTLTVRISNTDYPGIVPSDFAGYDVGSWVYLLRQGGEGLNINPNQEFSSSDNIEFGTLRAVPFDLSGHLDITGELETIDMDYQSDFPNVFNYGYFEGTIKEVDEDAGTADISVYIDGVETEFSDVTVFYHCQDHDTQKGASAFKEDDEVIVLNENEGGTISSSDLTVIGFQNGLKKCGTYLYIYLKGRSTTVPSVSSGWVIIWDLQSNDYAQDVVDDNGDEVTSWPVKRDLLDDFLSGYSYSGSACVKQPDDNEIELPNSYIPGSWSYSNSCYEYYPGGTCHISKTTGTFTATTSDTVVSGYGSILCYSYNNGQNCDNSTYSTYTIDGVKRRFTELRSLTNQATVESVQVEISVDSDVLQNENMDSFGSEMGAYLGDFKEKNISISLFNTTINFPSSEIIENYEEQSNYETNESKFEESLVNSEIFKLASSIMGDETKPYTVVAMLKPSFRVERTYPSCFESANQFNPVNVYWHMGNDTWESNYGGGCSDDPPTGAVGEDVVTFEKGTDPEFIMFTNESTGDPADDNPFDSTKNTNLTNAMKDMMDAIIQEMGCTFPDDDWEIYSMSMRFIS